MARAAAGVTAGVAFLEIGFPAATEDFIGAAAIALPAVATVGPAGAPAIAVFAGKVIEVIRRGVAPRGRFPAGRRRGGMVAARWPSEAFARAGGGEEDEEGKCVFHWAIGFGFLSWEMWGGTMCFRGLRGVLTAGSKDFF